MQRLAEAPAPSRMKAAPNPAPAPEAVSVPAAYSVELAILVWRPSVIPWWYSFAMPRGKPSPKLAITVDPDVHAQVVAAAAAEGVSVSAWMTAAARRALLVRDGLAAVAEWEAEHGAFTREELEAARQGVGADRPERQSA